MGNELVNYETHVKNYLNGKSHLEIADMAIYLGDREEFLKKPEKEDIEYLKKQFEGIPISNENQLKRFQELFYTKLIEIREKEIDGEMNKFLDKVKYKKELSELPLKLSRLEKTMYDGFKSLREPIKASLNYVWDAVMNHGFEMDEDGENALEKYNGNLSIRGHKSDLNDWDKELKIRLETEWKRSITIQKEAIKKVYKEKTKKVFGIFPKKYWKEVNTIIKAKEEDFLIDYTPTGEHNNIEKKINTWKKNLKEGDDINQKDLMNFIKVFLNLPKIMNNYIKRRHQNIEKMFGELK